MSVTPTTRVVQTTLGELISTLYEEFLADLGDEEVAAIATVRALDELLCQPIPEVERTAA